MKTICTVIKKYVLPTGKLKANVKRHNLLFFSNPENKGTLCFCASLLTRGLFQPYLRS